MNLFESMRAFVQIVEKGSMARAAIGMGISATMAGNHLSQLEARLGMKLLQRTTRRHSLTEFGKEYFIQCKDILERVNLVEKDAQFSQSKPRGRLRISAPITFGAEVLVPSLSKYRAQFPEVEIDLTLNDRQVDLIEEGIEVAIRIGSLADSNIIARQLHPYEMMICASPDYLAKHGIPEHPNELTNHSCITFHASAGSNWRMSIAGQEVQVPITNTIKVNNGQAIRVAALNNMGVILQPKALLEKDVSSGKLIQLFPQYQLPSRPMHIVYYRDQRMTLKLRSFIEFSVQTFG